MDFRTLLYWPHLICGVVAGIIIFIMSVTGVILMYERQIIAWGETEYESAVPENGNRMPIDDLINKVQLETGEKSLRTAKIYNNPEAPVVVRGKDYYYTNPYSGEILGNGPKGIKEFFSNMRRLHRWLLMEGESRDTARMITGASNLMFLFIVLSGIYLWLPRVLNWANIKKVLFFRKTKSSRARDFNWHNVMGIWSVIPLVPIIATATVFYYSWANNLVYQLAGEEPPVRNRSASDAPALEFDTLAPYQTMTNIAAEKRHNWNTLTLYIPKPADAEVRVNIDNGNGGEPTKKGDLYFDRETGDVSRWVDFSDNTPGRQARLFIRFLHTGEALGILGQTIAGIVSFFSAFLVWTGLALAYRKYLKPSRNKKATSEA